MATKKERRPSALTLAQSASSEKSPVYGHLWPTDSGNSPGSLPAGLPARLPYQLPEPVKTGGQRRPARLPVLPSTRWQGGARSGQPRTSGRESVAFGCAPGMTPPPLHMELGPPLSIHKVAELIGCSPWTVRQTLIPRGLPHFRFKASGRLIFYTNQIVGWIENQQGGQTTK